MKRPTLLVFFLATLLGTQILKRSFIATLEERETNSFLCDMNISTKIGSTRRDVVLFYTSSDTKGLRLSLKSLRTSGSRCRIILFVSSGFDPLPDFTLFAQKLDIEVIPHCDVYGRREFVPHMLRFEYEFKWLQDNAKNVDRVFHTDSLDVFFQGDPFTYHIPHDELVFITEPHPIRSCGWNLQWIRECYGKDNRWLHQNFIVCSGSISGSCQEYLKLLRLLISQRQWNQCWGKSHDQPILNYLIWKGVVAEYGIKYRFTGCDDGFFTVQWCVLERQVRYNEFGQIISLSDTVPSYIHQYNRLDGLTKRLYDMCHL